MLRVYDYKKNKISALKIIRNKDKFYNQGLVEIKVLKFIMDHDVDDMFYMVRIKNYLLFRNHIVNLIFCLFRVFSV